MAGSLQTCWYCSPLHVHGGSVVAGICHGRSASRGAQAETGVHNSLLRAHVAACGPSSLRQQGDAASFVLPSSFLPLAARFRWSQERPPGLSPAGPHGPSRGRVPHAEDGEATASRLAAPPLPPPPPPPAFVEERLPNGRIRRYEAGRGGHGLKVTDMDEGAAEGQQPLQGPALLAQLRAFALPAGFPASVSNDYWHYMLWQFPTNVSGWVCSTLVTSQLLRAVGISAGGGATAAAAAGIKWVSREGLGSVGRLLISGRFGNSFDEDPKFWRMYADVVGSLGGLLELATPLAPAAFLPLASAGNLAKAVARALKDPSSRVLQLHFARSNNLGDVAAKDEVWGVAAQLVGLAIGVALLDFPPVGSSYTSLAAIWLGARGLHLYLRYRSLATLAFPSLNYKRAATLVRAHVAGAPLPGVEEANVLEDILVPRRLIHPRMRFGCSFRDLVGASPRSEFAEAQELLAIYEEENYVLQLLDPTTMRRGTLVVFKEGASGDALLRSLWQAEWLHHSFVEESSLSPRARAHEDAAGTDSTERLRASVAAMEKNFDDFITKAESAGWDCDRIAIRPPSATPRLSVGKSVEP